MLHKLSLYTIEYFLSFLPAPHDEDQKEIYVYGLECFLNTVIPVILISIWSIFNHCIIESFIWICAFSTLRKYSGGYHAPSQWACITSSTLLGISNTYVIKIHTFSIFSIILLYILTLIIALLVCPIKSTKKSLSDIQYKRHKKYTCIILFIYMFFTFVLPTTYSLSIFYAVFICFILVLVTLLPSKV